MNAAILAHDPGARTVPYMMSGGTDAKAFAKLGVRCFGFAPLQLPRELDFAALFHGVDERVPVDSVCSAPRCSNTSCYTADLRAHTVGRIARRPRER